MKEENVRQFSHAELDSEVNFGIFYSMYYQRFVKYAYYYVNDLPAAEDMTNDALLYYWENRHKLTTDTDVLGYILLTVKHKCLNYLKHLQVEADYHKRYKKLHDWEITTRIQTLEDDSYGAIFSQDIMDLMTKALEELPEQTRRIFILNRLKNKTRREIAALFNISQQTVDYHIDKASKYLFHRLKDYILLLFLFF